ncbi:hypothetical protein PCANB_002132 [Pneumocystis canis]|nr:hypothetical protein PCANB_002132 [Pneumocystis canis]
MDDDNKEIQTLKEGPKVLREFKEKLLNFLENFSDIHLNVEKLIHPEQPELLDPELESFIHPVMNIIIKKIRNEISTQDFIHINKLCYILYTYSKISGYKTVIKFFFNDVYLLEPVLFYLQNIFPNDPELWVTRYIFFLWLSLLCMTPFDLLAVSSNLPENTNIIDSLLTLSKQYLSVCGKERDSASILIARLVVRKDTYKLYLPSFISWTRDSWISETTSIFMHSNDRIRHLITKLSQRVCICFLKPYEALWIHKIKEKKLVKNQSIEEPDNKTLSTFAEENITVHPAVEKCLYLLLENLSDISTTVRYSSAKGISRVISYMSESHANKVISAIISLIRDPDGSYSIDTSNDITWHGTSMAIAEICRKGLLLPYRLKEILPIILKALVFEQRRGTQYLGNNVRDAACYIAWSIFRRYSIDDVTHLFPLLTESLLTVALFDKETNIRRAASSAYQEGVGRYGESMFPHGIKLIKEINFYTVSTKKKSYLNVSLYLFKFQEYQDLIISYLAKKMAIHYDKEIRTLSAQALGRIAEIKPLLSEFKKKDIIIQHGVFGVLTEILPKIQYEDIPLNIIKELELISEEILPKNSLFASNDIHESACRYIAEISNTKYVKETYLLKWIDYIKYSLNIKADNVQHQASLAIDSLARRFNLHSQLNEFIIYIKSNSNKPDTLACGLVYALGEIKYFEKYQDILELFINITPSSNIIFKKNSIKTLGKILSSSKEYFLSSSFDFECLHLDKLIQLFLNGLNDYSKNSQGDIGSWIRKESMISIFHVLEVAFNYNIYFLTDALFHSIIGSLLRQTVGKLDSVREIAGIQLKNIISLCQNKQMSHLFESITFIENILKKVHNWRAPEDIIPNIIQLLHIKKYQDYILVGLINSINGNESLVKQIEIHTVLYLTKLPIEENNNSLTLSNIGNSLLRLCELNINNNYFMICFMEFCNILFERLIFESLVGKFNTCKSTSVQKISLSIKIYTGISKLSIETASESLHELLILLQHSYPIIRTQAAEGLYMALSEKNLYMSNENLYSKVIDILIKTSWIKSIEENEQYVKILQDTILNL